MSNRRSPEDSQSGVAGRSMMFSIPGGAGILEAKEIFCRLSPADVQDSAQYNKASVFFVESRNLHTLPPQFKGVLCAIYMGSTMRKSSTQNPPRWRLCIVWKIIPERDSLQVFVWKGPTRPAEEGGGGAVPAFFYAFREFGYTTNQAFNQHFIFTTVQGDGKRIVFLNQVNGEKPGHKPYTFCHLNRRDGCF